MPQDDEAALNHDGALCYRTRGPCHLHFIQNVAPAPAKLATVRSNNAIVHQSVLRVFGWTKKSCIGPPANSEIAEKGAASGAADHPAFRKPDFSLLL